MSIPVQVISLPVAASVDISAVSLIHQFGIDFQIATTTLNSPNFANISAVPQSPSVSDQMLINQGSSNYKLSFSRVGFATGTQMWCFQSTAPAYWRIIPNTSDCLLGVVGGPTFTAAYAGAIGIAPEFGIIGAGSWQQTDVTLAVNQIPYHTHTFVNPPFTSGSSFSYVNVSQDSSGVSVLTNSNFSSNKVTMTTNASTATGGPHNHGDSWRPFTAVGYMIVKVDTVS